MKILCLIITKTQTMYTTVLKTGALTLATFALILVACNKKSSTTNTTTTTNNNSSLTADDNGGYASDAAKAENTSNDVISIADAAAGGTAASNLRETSTCASISYDTLTSGMHTITVDFGSTDCRCADGRYRRGKIIVTFYGRYKDSASSHTINLSNYYVDDIHIGGSKIVTNMGRNSSGQYYYSVHVNDSIIWATDSITTRTATRTRTWVSGYSTSYRFDDVYNITGADTLTRANGHVFYFSITAPLRVQVGCPYIESGIVTISSSSFAVSPHTLDYGSDTTCPATGAATLTIGSHTYSIIIH